MARNKTHDGNHGWYVLSVLHHDGVVYEAGERVSIADQEQSKALFALGVITQQAPLADDEPSAA